MLRALGTLALTSALILPGLARADHGHEPWFDWRLGGGARIGVDIVELTPQLRDFFEVAPEQGVLVSDVLPDSPAAAAGLQAGDVILEADGRKIASRPELVQAVRDAEEGERVELVVSREGKTREIEVRPEHPEPRMHQAMRRMRPWGGEALRELRHQVEALEERLRELERRLAEDSDEP